MDSTNSVQAGSPQMVNTNDILGMNARGYLFTSRYNKKSGKKVADHKLLTKSLLLKSGLKIPKLYRVFRKFEEIDKFNFLEKLPESFVIKPDNSLGGEGIVVIRKRGKYAGEWVTTDGKTLNISDFKLHIQDILEGSYSMKNTPDIAFIEERIRIHPVFAKVCWGGTPDIGVIVFNRVPVMAFLRLPTKESGGRANMFQGALACGIDMATGITTHAVKWTTPIRFYPNSRRRLVGIKIPEWDKVLKTAIECQIALPSLGFMRADIVLQPSLKTPGKTLVRVLELNAQPGLKIQLANKAGLLGRLKRLEGLEVEDADKGIKIAKALFADPKLRDVSIGKRVIGVFETVKLQPFVGDPVEIKAKIDTGAFRTSIDEKLAKELGLLNPENVIMEKDFWSSLGKQTRPVIELTFWLKSKKIKTNASVTDRTKLKRPMLVGRRDLGEFLVEPKGL